MRAASWQYRGAIDRMRSIVRVRSHAPMKLLHRRWENYRAGDSHIRLARLDVDNLAIHGGKRTAELGFRQFDDSIQFLVAAAGRVVDEADILSIGKFGKTDRLLPGRVAITAVETHFLICKHGVVEKEIDVPDQFEHVFVDLSRLMLRIGDDGQRLSFPVQTVPNGVAGMIEHAGSDRESGMNIEHIARQEVPRRHLRAANLQWDREPGGAHEVFEHFPRRHGAAEVARPDGNVIGAVIEGFKIGEANDVIVVTVGKEEIDVGNAFGAQGKTRRMKARTRIEQQNVITASHLDADGIPAVFSEVFT
ncbi:hypothetical protein AT6N2_C2913 [Agrobacterium tumefaciens]|nr:hypothetical protein AT6N2_C2913 [Agrobacterium tumefaciens]